MTLRERFEQYVSPEPMSGCWLWAGAMASNGYGRFFVGPSRASRGKQAPASRVAWELEHGPVPPGLFVCHRCDNPPCVNPGHLFLATNRENALDMVRKDRHRCGSRSPNAKVTEKIAVDIRKRRRAGESAASLGREYGISDGTVSSISLGRSWRHVSEPTVEPAHREGK